MLGVENVTYPAGYNHNSEYIDVVDTIPKDLLKAVYAHMRRDYTLFDFEMPPFIK